jgi:hypothetical protein
MIRRLPNSKRCVGCKMQPIGVGTNGRVIKRDAKRQRSPFEDGKLWETTRREAAFPTYSHRVANSIPLFPTLFRPTIRGFPRFPIALEARR